MESKIHWSQQGQGNWALEQHRTWIAIHEPKAGPLHVRVERFDGDPWGTSHPSGACSSWPKVPARICSQSWAHSWGHQSETYSLTIVHLGSSPDQWRKTRTRRKIFQPTLKSALPFLLHLSIHSNPWAMPKFSVLHSGTIFNCKTSYHTKQWATLEAKAFT